MGTKRFPWPSNRANAEVGFVCRTLLNDKQKGEIWRKRNLAAVVIARRPIVLQCRIEVNS